jgi:hypothetical protein
MRAIAGLHHKAALPAGEWLDTTVPDIGNRMNRAPTAYHEAGHAVIAHALGYTPRSVSIIPRGEDTGLVRHAAALRGVQSAAVRSARARLRIERAIQICFAGPLAQRRYRARSWRHQHGRSDFAQAAALARRLCRSKKTAAALLQRLEIAAGALVEAHWADIAQVAETLIERQEMAGREIVACLNARHV